MAEELNGRKEGKEQTKVRRKEWKNRKRRKRKEWKKGSKHEGDSGSG